MRYPGISKQRSEKKWVWNIRFRSFLFRHKKSWCLYVHRNMPCLGLELSIWLIIWHRLLSGYPFSVECVHNFHFLSTYRLKAFPACAAKRKLYQPHTQLATKRPWMAINVEEGERKCKNSFLLTVMISALISYPTKELINNTLRSHKIFSAIPWVSKLRVHVLGYIHIDYPLSI